MHTTTKQITLPAPDALKEMGLPELRKIQTELVDACTEMAKSTYTIYQYSILLDECLLKRAEESNQWN